MTLWDYLAPKPKPVRLELHMLRPLAIGNLNRDSEGRAKTVTIGDVPRLRVSKAAQARAVRLSSDFRDALSDYRGKLGIRTADPVLRVADEARELALASGVVVPSDPDLHEHCKKILLANKAMSDKKSAKKVVGFFSLDEISACAKAVVRVIAQGGEFMDEEKAIFAATTSAIDLALFGRMNASDPEVNITAALNGSHQFTVNSAENQIDYFVAMADDGYSGAGHLSEKHFGSGMFYEYAVVDVAQLLRNLNGDETAARVGLCAYIGAELTVCSDAKRSEFATSGTPADYVLAQYGTAKSMTLSTAFFEPVSRQEDASIRAQAIARLTKRNANLNKCYGRTWSGEPVVLDVEEGKGEVSDFLAMANAAVDAAVASQKARKEAA